MNKPMNKPIYSFEPNYSWPCDYCKEKFIDVRSVINMNLGADYKNVLQ